jgi:hypothetical protein
MRRIVAILLPILLTMLAIGAAVAENKPKIHLISYGKTMIVKLFLGPEEEQSVPIKVRALYIDGKLREFVTGDTHEVTDRLFVVRRAFRLNNSLPTDEARAPGWIWERGGWLLVDRQNGHISQIALADFDPFYSEVSWFRDYAAYCGTSDNGGKLTAVVMQLGRHKPILRKELGAASQGETPDSECAVPQWEKKPSRVTFQPRHGSRQSFSIFGHAWDLAPGSEEEAN